MADNDLMYRTLDVTIAAAAIDQWNQKVWCEINECGSAFCYAGHLLHMEGWLPKRLVGSESWDQVGMVKDNMILRWTEIGAYARDRLGLTNAQADALFEEDNTLEDLKRLVDEIANGEFEEPKPIMWAESEVPF